MAELSNEGSGIVAASSVAENRPAASRSDTFTVAKVGTAARILVRASSSLSTRNLFDQHSPISNVSLAIGDYSSYSRASRLVRWLSGRKQRFAKAPYPKRVPRVRIPPSPPWSLKFAHRFYALARRWNTGFKPVRRTDVDICGSALAADKCSYNNSYDKSATTGDDSSKAERSRLDVGFNVVSHSE